MKLRKCPTCGRTYIDETLSFCLEDGAPLIYENDSHEFPTQAMGRPDIIGEATTAAYRSDHAETPRRRVPVRALIAGAAALALLIMSIVLGYVYFGPARDTRIGTIAVLPLKNETGSSETDYLSDGMTELLIGKLSQLPDLGVKARSSVFRYKGQDVQPASVGADLKVDAILMGRFAKAGERYVFNLELVDTRHENVVWTEQYTRDAGHLSNLQNDIARDVAEKLRAKLSGATKQRFQQNDNASAEAYEYYLRGRFFWYKRSGEGLERSIDYFNRAIAVDPGYAMAFAGLADAYALLPFYASADPADSFAKTHAAATRAVEINPDLAEPHAVLGFVKMWHDFDGVGAESEFRRSIELNPNYSTGHHWYALFLATRERHVEAAAEIQQALNLDPFSVGINLDLGVTNFYARRYQDAEVQLRKTLEMDPNFLQIHLFLAETLEQNQSFEEAADAWFEVIRIAGGDPSAATALKRAFESGGERAYYGEKLNILLERWKRRGEGAFNIAEVYSRLGDSENAFEWLDKAIAARQLNVPTLLVTPGFDNIRRDPRFADHQRRAGL